MSDKKLSAASLNNLKQANKEINQLTCEALETALLHLLETKDLACISISELVKKAGVSRTAFYRNYRSKEQLLENIFEHVIRRVMTGFMTINLQEQATKAWHYLFSETKKEAKLYKLALSRNEDGRITKIVIDILEEEARKKEIKTTTPYAYSFWATAIIAILSRWVREGMKVSIDDMANMGLPLFPK